MAPPADGDDGFTGGGGSGPSTDWIDELQDLASVDTTSLGSSFTKLLLLPIAAFFISAADLVESMFGIFIQPLNSLGINIAGLFDALVGGSGDVLRAGVEATARDVSIFGIAGFPVSFAIVAVVTFMFGWVLSRDDTSDIVPFTATDLPLIGADEDEE